MNCSCVNYISRGTATAPPTITTAEALRYSSLPMIGFGLDVLVERFNFDIVPKIVKVEYDLGLICTTPSQFYLDVTPETIWLNPENGFSSQVSVSSNVEWKIE